jgi:hypothetical protein
MGANYSKSKPRPIAPPAPYTGPHVHSTILAGYRMEFFQIFVKYVLGVMNEKKFKGRDSTLLE